MTLRPALIGDQPFVPATPTGVQHRGHGRPPQAVAVKTESNGDSFLRLWRYLTVGEVVAEAKDVIDEVVTP